MKCTWKTGLCMIMLAGALCVGHTAVAESFSLELQATVEAEHTVTVTSGPGGRITLEDGTPVTEAFRVNHN